MAAVTELLAAGHETTSGLIGNAVLARSEHPEALRCLRDDPGLVPAAIDELTRWDSPVQVTSRVARTATSLAGHHIHGGDQAVVLIGAANRDPAVFTNPDRLDILRPTSATLAFGTGAHYCIGAALARAEAAEVLAQLIHRPWRLLDWERSSSTTFRRLSRLTVEL